MLGSFSALTSMYKSERAKAPAPTPVELLQEKVDAIGHRSIHKSRIKTLMADDDLGNKECAERIIEELRFIAHKQRYNSLTVEMVKEAITGLCDLHGLPVPDPIPFYQYAPPSDS